MSNRLIDISTVTLPLVCPQCGVTNQFTFAQVTKGEKIVCTGCGINIELRDHGSIAKAQSSVDNSIKSLQTTIRNINRRLKRK